MWSIGNTEADILMKSTSKKRKIYFLTCYFTSAQRNTDTLQVFDLYEQKLHFVVAKAT